ncbi:MAG: DUF1667 domain-containing protein [Clostridiales bacterium]|jgi:CxxC motif-containing protein|nr:DUF1667 domain-containing protein [Clostridiales bacterium]
MGCELLVVTEVSEEGGPPSAVSGNACKIGERYGREEATNPTRVMTSSVRVLGGDMKMLSVKTARPIPKGKIWDCAEAMRGLSVNAPVKIGDIIIKNAASTGVDIIATRNIARGSA